jgi:hypothetical protein
VFPQQENESDEEFLNRIITTGEEHLLSLHDIQTAIVKRAANMA